MITSKFTNAENKFIIQKSLTRSFNEEHGYLVWRTRCSFLGGKSHAYMIEGLLRELTFVVFIPDSQSKESRKSKERQWKARIFGVLVPIGAPKSLGPLLFSNGSYSIGQGVNCKGVASGLQCQVVSNNKIIKSIMTITWGSLNSLILTRGPHPYKVWGSFLQAVFHS